MDPSDPNLLAMLGAGGQIDINQQRALIAMFLTMKKQADSAFSASPSSASFASSSSAATTSVVAPAARALQPAARTLQPAARALQPADRASNRVRKPSQKMFEAQSHQPSASLSSKSATITKQTLSSAPDTAAPQVSFGAVNTKLVKNAEVNNSQAMMDNIYDEYEEPSVKGSSVLTKQRKNAAESQLSGINED